MSEKQHKLRAECLFRICENRRRSDLRIQSKKKLTESKQELSKTCPFCTFKDKRKIEKSWAKG
jgi:hypothetical protein